MIREANLKDLNEIAELHMQSFENHFLPKLGLKLLSKYYKEFLDEGNVFLISVDEKTNKINGLILGTPNSAIGRNRFINNNKIRLLLRILVLCLKLDKDTWIRVFSLIKSFVLLDRSKKVALNNDKPNLKVLTLLSICVSNQYKGKGIFKILVENLEQKLIKCGYEGYILTVHKTNDRANNFYDKLSMRIYKESDTEFGYIKQLVHNN